MLDVLLPTLLGPAGITSEPSARLLDTADARPADVSLSSLSEHSRFQGDTFCAGR